MIKSVRVRYRNASSSPVRLVVEPWANEFEVAPGKDLEVQFDTEGEEIPLLELVNSGSEYVIHAQSGTLRLLQEKSD